MLAKHGKGETSSNTPFISENRLLSKMLITNTFIFFLVLLKVLLSPSDNKTTWKQKKMKENCIMKMTP